MSVPKQQKEPVGWFWVAAAPAVAVLVTQLLLERGQEGILRYAYFITGRSASAN